MRDLLFTRGKQDFCYPFRIKYMIFSDSAKGKGSDHFHYPAKCLISVSRHNFRKASGRNRIKRLTREAYRKNKKAFYAFLKQRELRCTIALIYVAKEELDYSEIENRLGECLKRVMLLIDRGRGPEQSI